MTRVFAILAAAVAVAALGGMWAIAQTISVELFPTELRATANGLAHNLLGRLGMTIGPALVGTLAVGLGSTGDAVTLLVLLDLAALPAIALLLPETRGVRLGAAVAVSADEADGRGGAPGRSV